MPHFNVGSGLRSPLDSDDLTNAHKKTSVTNRSTFNLATQVAQHETMLGKLRRRVLTPPIPVPPSNFYQPFDFYNTTNSTKAKDYKGNPAPSWQVYQMRDGFFSGRSKFNASGYFGLFEQGDKSYNANYEIICPVFNDLSDFLGQTMQPTPLPQTVSYTLLNAGTDTVLFDPTFATAGTCGQIILNAMGYDTYPSETALLYSSFWLEIVDELQSPTTGFYAKLWGRTWDAGGAAGLPTDPFPTPAQNLIPLCVLTAGSYFPPYIQQIVSGHITYNYPSMVGTNGIGNGVNFRGDWTDDSLSGQYFYPADLVTNGTFTTFDGFMFRNQFLRKTYGATTNAPVDGVDWLALASS